jgi:cytochrome c oxidase subunit IV
MEHTIESLAQEHHVGGGRKEIYRVTIILTVFTLIELGLGFYLMVVTNDLMRHFLKGVIIIFMLAKAFYIVGYFMHLRHEIRNLIMTIVVPLFLFVWFIVAFLTDGNSFKNLKNSLDRGHKERSEQQAPAKPEGEEHKME